VIAVALGLISAVVMITTGVMVSSSSADRLTFLGVGVDTTTAQVFVTGAIFAWLFVVALWLLRVGMQRSGARCAELAGRWAGFGDRRHRPEADELFSAAAGAGTGPPPPVRVDLAGVDLAGVDPGGVGLAGIGLAAIDLTRFGAAGVDIGPSGAGGDDGPAPWRVGGGPDEADLGGTPAVHQDRAVGAHRPSGPGAAVRPAAAALGIRVHRPGERPEVGRRTGPVPGEHGGPDRQGQQRPAGQ
jgi:hypothetical protein